MGKHTRFSLGSAPKKSYSSEEYWPVSRADDRRKTGNSEGRRASFDSGFSAQTEAKLTNSDDVGQGKGRARESAWGSNRGAGGWTPY